MGQEVGSVSAVCVLLGFFFPWKDVLPWGAEAASHACSSALPRALSTSAWLALARSSALALILSALLCVCSQKHCSEHCGHQRFCSFPLAVLCRVLCMQLPEISFGKCFGGGLFVYFLCPRSTLLLPVLTWALTIEQLPLEKAVWACRVEHFCLVFFHTAQGPRIYLLSLFHNTLFPKNVVIRQYYLIISTLLNSSSISQP